MTTATERQLQDDPFITYLLGLYEKDARGALAALRRGLGQERNMAREMFPYVIPRIPGNAQPDRYFTVAALFAWHPRHQRGGNLGDSFRQLRVRLGEGHEQSVDRRFASLLSGAEEDLPDRLRTAVGMLRSNDIPVDWSRLLWDLMPGRWDDPARRIQWEWARSYWRPERPEQPGSGGPGDTPSDDGNGSNEDSDSQ